jgi:hypothetical protein
MAHTTKTTRLGRIQIALSEGLIEALKGEPLRDGDDNPILKEDGSPVLGPPKVGILKEAREYLKDMGITEEPEEAEGRTVHEISGAVKQFEADEDTLLLEATKEAAKSTS